MLVMTGHICSLWCTCVFSVVSVTDVQGWCSISPRLMGRTLARVCLHMFKPGYFGCICQVFSPETEADVPEGKSQKERERREELKLDFEMLMWPSNERKSENKSVKTALRGGWVETLSSVFNKNIEMKRWKKGLWVFKVWKDWKSLTVQYNTQEVFYQPIWRKSWFS